MSKNNLEERRIMWFGTVIDNTDPLMLNRVRIKFDQKNNEDILRAIPNTYKGKTTKTKDGADLLPEFKWSDIDSFCFLPLLPIFISVKPKNNETVNLIFPNIDFKYSEQYYVPGIFSSPLTIYKENFNAQRMFASKNRLKDPKLLKNPTNYEYYNTKTKGVFIEPDDIGLQGRGTCDIVIKENDVILRAGKSTTTPNSTDKVINVNPKRSFIQLSNFTQREQLEDPIQSEVFNSVISYVKTLAEWNIINPENQYDLFTYELSYYRLPEKKEYTTENLQIDSEVLNNDKAIIFKRTFTNQSMSEMTQTINLFIEQCNNNQLNLPTEPIINLTNQFPIYFRPSKETYLFLNNSTNGVEYNNVSKAANNISFKNQKNGVGLITSKDNTGQQVQSKTVTETQKSINPNSPVTYNVQGGDKMLFISHESKIPSRQQITLGDDTVYGIAQSYLAEQVVPNTDPMVRGDELMKFLNTIVKYLISHVHAYPGISPVQTATDGTTVAEILQQLQNASQTILNQNIRIN
jgi:hypothetical protein